jgi:Ca2+/Na+ antiporter
MLDPGLIGAIVGASIGIAGGILGTWMSIRSSPRGNQRRFMVKASILCWAGALTFVLFLLLLPEPWKWWMWALYGPLLLILILYINRTMAKMRTGNTKTATH